MPSLFFLILVAILTADLLWWVFANRFLRSWRHAFWGRLFLGLFLGGQVAVVLWMLSGRALVEYRLGRPSAVLSASVYLWHLLLLPALWTLVLAVGLVVFVWRLGRRFVRRRGAASQKSTDQVVSESPAPAPADGAGGLVGRRRFLGMATAVTPALLTGAGVTYSLGQVQRFRIRSMELPLPGLPRGLDGLQIALVSDLHVGTFTNGQVVKRIVDETSRLGADFVLMPGDLINNSLADLPEALDAVSNMQSKYGSYLSVGNHDLIEDGAEFIRAVKVRAPLLVDESRFLTIRGHRVQLLGLPWNYDEQGITTSVQTLARQLDPEAFPILLAHHPHAFDAAAAAGIPLTVAGHTHGGQLMLSDSVGFGPMMYRYWSGLYRKPEQNGASLVVSNGVGNWFPLRVGAPAEIIHLTLRSEAKRS